MALREAGIRLTLQGQAEYKAGLKGISQEMRTMSTESKLSVAQLGNNATITDTYSTRMKSMGTEIETAGKKAETFRNQQEKLSKVMTELPGKVKDTNSAWRESQKETERLENNYKQMSKALGENHAETLKAKAAYEESKTATSNLKTEHSELSRELNRTEKELSKLPNELAKAELATQKLRNEAEKLHTEYRNAGGQYADIAKGWQDVGQSITTTGEAMTKTGDWMTTRFTVPIVAGFGAAIKTGLTFDAQMRQTASIAGLTADDLTTAGGAYEQLREQAIQLGADSIFGATDVATAQEMMASAGFEVVEIIGAIPGVMDLAAVSGKNMALASEAVATAMNQFGFEASDATHIADVFARAAADTNAETTDMAEALKYAGNVLGPMGISFEETAAAIGIMSNAGVKGSQAGTALRGAFTRLANPTKQVTLAMEDLGWSAYDAEGNMKPLNQMIPELQESLKGLTNEQRDQYLASIFGTNALSGMLALVNAAPGELSGLTHSLENSAGAAQQMADVINSGANGAIEELMGAVETLSIELFDALAPSLITIVEGITGAVEAFSALDDETKLAIVQGALFVAAAGPIVSVLGRVTTGTGKVVTGVGDMIKLFGKLTTPKTLTELGTGMGTLTTTTGTATAGVGLLKTGLALLTSPLGIAAITVGTLYGAYKILAEDAVEANDALLSFPDITGITATQAESLRETAGAVNEIDIALDTLGTNSTSHSATVVGAFSDISTEISRINTQKVTDLESVLKNLPENVRASIQSSVEASIEDAQGQIARAQAIQEEISNIYKTAKEEQRELHNSELQRVKGLQAELTKIYADAFGQTYEQQQQAYANLTADLDKMSDKVLVDRQNTIRDYMTQEKDVLEQGRADLETALTLGAIDQTEFDAGLVQLEQNYKNSILKLEKAAVENAKEMGNRLGLTGQELIRFIADQTGLEFNEVITTMQREMPDVISAVDNMIQPLVDSPAKVQEAANNWNKAIDEFAKGKGVTPDQLGTESIEEFIGQANDLGLTWEDLELLSKDAEVDDNLKDFINKAAEAQGGWDAVIFAEKNADVNVMGVDELEALITLFGVDFANLTDEQKQALIDANGAKELSDLMVDWGIWVSTDPAEAKQAVIETDAALMAFQPLLESLGLWNSTEFLSKYADIDTNAPEAQEQILQLIADWSGVSVEEVKSLMTENNADESAEKVDEYNTAVAQTPGEVHSTVTTNTGGVGASTGEVENYTGAANNMPTEKSSSISTNIFSMLANTLAVGFYNTAVGNIEDKSSNVKTTAAGIVTRTIEIKNYNSERDKLKDASSRVTTTAANIVTRTRDVNSWMAAVTATRDKTSTLTTRTPSIVSNTNSVWSWISALNSAYNRTSTLTTRRVTAYSTTGRAPAGFAEGGHIDAYADGGNIQWGGMFAGGGNVPQGYMGIVGEAGPELFHVTKGGVSITPLAPGEKMRGIEGAIEKYMEGKGGGNSGSAPIMINLEINHPIIKDETSIRELAEAVSETITRNVTLNNLFNKGRTA